MNLNVYVQRTFYPLNTVITTLLTQPSLKVVQAVCFHIYLPTAQVS